MSYMQPYHGKIKDLTKGYNNQKEIQKDYLTVLKD